MRGPVIHVTDLEELNAYVAYLYQISKISPDAWQSLGSKQKAAAADWNPTFGKDLYVINTVFETVTHPAGVDCSLLIRVNSFDQFKRYLAIYLAQKS